MGKKKIWGKPAPITWGVVNYYPYQVKNLKDTMKDLTIEQEAIMQLIQELYVLRTTVICWKTVEERVKESNTVPEDAMIKGKD